MSSEWSFHGTLGFASIAVLDEALAAARALVDDEDEDLADLIVTDWEVSFQRSGTSLVVALSIHGPSEWWFCGESIIEVLTEAAVSGHIDGTLEGAPDQRYPAGGDGDGDDGDDDDALD